MLTYADVCVRAAPALHPLCQYFVLFGASKASKAPLFVLAKQLSPRSASSVSVFCTFFWASKASKASTGERFAAHVCADDVC